MILAARVGFEPTFFCVKDRRDNRYSNGPCVVVTLASSEELVKRTGGEIRTPMSRVWNPLLPCHATPVCCCVYVNTRCSLCQPLSRLDSNEDFQGQNLAGCHYPTGDRIKLGRPLRIELRPSGSHPDDAAITPWSQLRYTDSNWDSHVNSVESCH
jgi:hypothetical protein